MEGRTTLIVAHRLSTLRRADRVVVINRGEVIEQGPHDFPSKAGYAARQRRVLPFICAGPEG